jgi:hypothetical protein
MQKTILAQTLTALIVFTAAIYFVAAVEESQEEEVDANAQVNEQEAASSGDSENAAPANSAANQEEQAEGGGGEGGDALATQVQIAFFTVAGLGYAGVGIWMFKDKGKTNAPYVIAVVGSIALIGIYVASRTVNLPIVGLQEDVGAIDILTKVLQVGIVGLGAYMINTIKVTKSVYSR